MHAYRQLKPSGRYQSRGFQLTLIRKGYRKNGDFTPLISVREHNETLLLCALEKGVLRIRNFEYKVVKYKKLMHIDDGCGLAKCVYDIILERDGQEVDVPANVVKESKTHGLWCLRIRQRFFIEDVPCLLIHKRCGHDVHRPVIGVPWKQHYRFLCLLGRDYVVIENMIYSLIGYDMFEDNSQGKHKHYLKQKYALFSLNLSVPGMILSSKNGYNYLDELVSAQ